MIEILVFKAHQLKLTQIQIGIGFLNVKNQSPDIFILISSAFAKAMAGMQKKAPDQ